MAYALGCGTNAADLYGVRGIPHAFLIAPDGKIAWEGHPASLQDAQIEAILAEATGPGHFYPPDDLPASFAAARSALLRHQYSGALRALERIVAADTPDAPRAAALRDEILAFMQEPLDEARAHLNAGRLVSAADGYDSIRQRFPGTTQAQEAAAELETLRRDPLWRDESMAMRALRQGDDLAEGGKQDDARRQYEAVLARFPDTEAAGLARRRLGLPTPADEPVADPAEPPPAGPEESVGPADPAAGPGGVE